MNETVNVHATRLEGPSPAAEIARDLAKRGTWVAPLVLAFGCFWGLNGMLSAGYALVIVVVNFLLAGWMLTVGGRISFVAMAGAAMFGYLIRLAIITLAVFPVLNLSWVEKVPLGVTLIVTHLGLLAWELRHLSLSYAYPGLKPSERRGNGPSGTAAGVSDTDSTLPNPADRPASAA